MDTELKVDHPVAARQSDLLSDFLSVSFVIPVHNEERNIGTLLEQLRPDRRWRNADIVVSSDASTDRTEEIVRSFPEVQLLKAQRQQGKVAALKAAFAKATGDLVVMLDGDVVLDPQALPRVIDRFRDPAVKACTARLVTLSGRSRFMSRLAEVGYLAWHRYRRWASERGEAFHPSGTLLAIRRDVLGEIEISDSVINDDAFIAQKLIQTGVRFHYVSDARVYAMLPQNLREFVAQRTRVRIGRRQFPDNAACMQQERRWRGAMYRVACNPRHSALALVYLLIDAYCRGRARLAVRRLPENAHIRSGLPSTKFDPRGQWGRS